MLLLTGTISAELTYLAAASVGLLAGRVESSAGGSAVVEGPTGVANPARPLRRRRGQWRCGIGRMRSFRPADLGCFIRPAEESAPSSELLARSRRRQAMRRPAAMAAGRSTSRRPLPRPSAASRSACLLRAGPAGPAFLFIPRVARELARSPAATPVRPALLPVCTRGLARAGYGAVGGRHLRRGAEPATDLSGRATLGIRRHRPRPRFHLAPTPRRAAWPSRRCRLGLLMIICGRRRAAFSALPRSGARR